MSVTTHKKISTILFSSLLLMLIIVNVSGQVTIKLLKIPENTPATDSIFISGTFNSWNPKDTSMRLMPQHDGMYSITFSPGIKYFEYKFTRGNWNKVEGKKNENAPNRIFSNENSQTIIETSIDTWIDLENIKIVVLRLPFNTPQDAEIFMIGPFNYWNPSDPAYKLVRLENGSYQYNFIHLDSLSFKFTRGSFQSMESDVAGDPIAMRKLTPSKSKSKVIQYNIEGWEDLYGTTSNFLEGILLLSAGLGIFVIIGLSSVQNPRREHNNFLSIMLALISLVLLIRVLLHYHYFFYQAPKLILLPLLLLFAFGPLLNVHTKSIVREYRSIVLKEYLIMLLPLTILLIGLFPLIIADKNHLISMLLNHELDINFEIIVGTAIVFNLYYFFRAYKVLEGIKLIEGSGLLQRAYYRYIGSQLLIGLTIILLLTSIFFVSLQNFRLSTASRQEIIEQGLNGCWLVLCLFPFTIVWFAIVCPEIFSLNFEIERSKSKESIGAVKLKLDELMETKKPFLDPDLSLESLAELLHTNAYTLARLVGESSEKNFYDFINAYRVHEFKKRLESGQHKTKTILAIANEVGFKSKPTFNRTFKRISGVTPRDYLYSLQD